MGQIGWCDDVETLRGGGDILRQLSFRLKLCTEKTPRIVLVLGLAL